ncbi:energy-coupling factor ABC transporter permease [Patescibacteria group bacterium]|nr:energy-coupling factor ABC transporter permease [Patescibacteria group bacterium]
MHLPDGFLSKEVAGGLLGGAAFVFMYAAQHVRQKYFNARAVLKKNLALEGGFSIESSFKLSKKWKKAIQKRMLLAATMGSLVFALQMLNFPISKGTSGHFLGGLLLALVLGPFEAFVVIALVLTVQCVAFSDGGLFVLGGNVFNMGVVAAVGGFYLFRYIWNRIKKTRKNYFVLAAILAWISVVLASTFCAFEIYLSGTTDASVFSAMISYHALIGLGEAGITILVLAYMSKSSPLPFIKQAKENEK